MKITVTGKRHSSGQIASLIQFGRIGRRALMEAARLAVEIDPRILPIIEDWDRMKPSLQNAVDLDTLCEAHGVDPAHFIGVVGEAEAKYGNDSAILIAALRFPEVIMRSLKTALTKRGFKDRQALMEHAGFLPQPNGSQVGTLNYVAIRAEANTNIGKPLPTFEQTIAALDKRMQDEE